MNALQGIALYLVALPATASLRSLAEHRGHPKAGGANLACSGALADVLNANASPPLRESQSRTPSARKL